MGHWALTPKDIIKSLNVSKEVGKINYVLAKTEWYTHEDRDTCVIQIRDFSLTVHQQGAIRQQYTDAGWLDVTFKEETNPNATNITFHKDHD